MSDILTAYMPFFMDLQRLIQRRLDHERQELVKAIELDKTEEMTGKIWKDGLTVILWKKYTRALTFENFWNLNFWNRNFTSRRPSASTCAALLYLWSRW
jgi:hypothetical protein